MGAKRVAKENKWGDKSRFYSVKGKEYPSVTTVLSVIGKPALVAWSAKVEREMVMQVSADLYETLPAEPKMSKMGWTTTLSDRLGKTKASQKELAKASEIGSQAHALIEYRIKSELMHDVGPCPVITPPAALAVAAWDRWKDSVNFKPLLCEQAVWSETHEYAGTMDVLAEINGVPTLVDWKTGKAIYQEALLQNAAYRNALKEMGIYGETAGMIVRLPKLEGEPEFEVRAVTEPANELFKVFLSVMDLWRWLNAKEVLTEVAHG